MTIYGIIISVINSFIYIKLIKCLIFDTLNVKKEENSYKIGLKYNTFNSNTEKLDFFSFYKTNMSEVSFLNGFLFSFVLLISIFLCISPFYLNEILDFLLILAKSSFMVFSLY
jgi:hypothetical protein